MDYMSYKHDAKAQRLKNLKFKGSANKGMGVGLNKSSLNRDEHEFDFASSDESSYEFDEEERQGDDGSFLNALKISKGADYAVLLEEKSHSVLMDPPPLFDMCIELQHDWNLPSSTFYSKSSSQPSQMDILSLDLEKIGKSLSTLSQENNFLNDFAFRLKIDEFLSPNDDDDKVYTEFHPYVYIQNDDQKWKESNSNSNQTLNQKSKSNQDMNDTQSSFHEISKLESIEFNKFEEMAVCENGSQIMEPEDGRTIDVISEISRNDKKAYFEKEMDEKADAKISDLLDSKAGSFESGSFQEKKTEKSVDELLDLLDDDNNADKLFESKFAQNQTSQVGQVMSTRIEASSPLNEILSKKTLEEEEGFLHAKKKETGEKQDIPHFSVDDILDMIDTVKTEKGVEMEKDNFGKSDILEMEMKGKGVDERKKEVNKEDDDFDAWFQSIE